MTKEEYFRRASERESGIVDWEDGVAIRMTPAHSRHGYFISYLHVQVNDFLEQQGRGAAWPEVFVDFGLRAYGVDIVGLFTEHLDRHVGGRIHGVPDLIVEVLSDDSVDRDRVVKFDFYWRQGVPWYWIGDPAAGTLEEYRGTPEGYLRSASGTLEIPFQPHALERGLTVQLARLIPRA